MLEDHGIVKLEELEYKWVDGYKHRQILTEIGWNYTTEDGYYTLEQAAVDESDRVEECLGYINNGLSGLTDYIMDSFDDLQKALAYDNPVFEQSLSGVESVLKSYTVYTMEDVNNYLTIIEDIKRGETQYIFRFARYISEQVKLFYKSEFEI